MINFHNISLNKNTSYLQTCDNIESSIMQHFIIRVHMLHDRKKEQYNNLKNKTKKKKDNGKTASPSIQFYQQFFNCRIKLKPVTLTKMHMNTFFIVRQTSEKSPGAILFVEASLVSSATASFLSDHLAAF